MFQYGLQVLIDNDPTISDYERGLILWSVFPAKLVCVGKILIGLEQTIRQTNISHLH